jgi:hypothetical protein
MTGIAAFLLSGPLGIAMALADIAGEQARLLAMGGAVEWGYRPPEPASFRTGDLTIDVREARAGAVRGGFVATVTRRGRQPQRIRTGPMGWVGCCSVTVGRIDRSGARYVMLGSHTGGPHCCWQIQVALPDGPRRAVVTIGAFDATPNMNGEIRDIDGDGRIDFVMGDDDFLYSFTSYAGSSAPPQVWNVVGGRALNVSAAPRYRALFVRAMNEFRPHCLRADWGFRNSACAAYVAAAARAGRFEMAWREMLGVHHRDDFEGRTFPQRLRAFLRVHGYLRG